MRAVGDCRWLGRVAEAKQGLLQLYASLQHRNIRFPGMGQDVEFECHVLLLKRWAPADAHGEYCLRLYLSMCFQLPYVASSEWMRGAIGRHLLGDAHAVANVMMQRMNQGNLSPKAVQAVETMYNIFKDGNAKWFLCPKAEGEGQDPGAGDARIFDVGETVSSGPALFVYVRYKGFPLVLCFAKLPGGAVLTCPEW